MALAHPLGGPLDIDVLITNQSSDAGTLAVFREAGVEVAVEVAES
jgi:DeoR family transcriptional regulator, fructose operon transcriptional repressor